jgi:hypothetical protein
LQKPTGACLVQQTYVGFAGAANGVDSRQPGLSQLSTPVWILVSIFDRFNAEGTEQLQLNSFCGRPPEAHDGSVGRQNLQKTHEGASMCGKKEREQRSGHRDGRLSVVRLDVSQYHIQMEAADSPMLLWLGFSKCLQEKRLKMS